MSAADAFRVVSMYRNREGPRRTFFDAIYSRNIPVEELGAYIPIWERDLQNEKELVQEYELIRRNGFTTDGLEGWGDWGGVDSEIDVAAHHISVLKDTISRAKAELYNVQTNRILKLLGFQRRRTRSRRRPKK